MAMSSVILANSMQTELRSQPIDTLMLHHDATSLKFLAFAFGFPLGIGLSLLGSLAGSETTRGRWNQKAAELRVVPTGPDRYRAAFWRRPERYPHFPQVSL
jgi:hypothetical protein